MIQWLRADGPTQRSKDQRYMVMHATDEYWIAYWQSDAREWVELGTFRDEGDARAVCESHARGLAAA